MHSESDYGTQSRKVDASLYDCTATEPGVRRAEEHDVSFVCHR